MKISSISIIAITVTLFLSCCSTEKKAIRDVAYGYVYATSNYEIDKAEPFASASTREHTIPFLKNFLLPITDSNFIKENTPASVTINSIEIDGDTAWAKYTRTTPKGTKTNTICVIKENGQWLVDVPLVLPESKYSPDSVTSFKVPATKQVIKELEEREKE